MKKRTLISVGSIALAGLFITGCSSDSSAQRATQNEVSASVAAVNPCTPESASWCHLITDNNPVTGIKAVPNFNVQPRTVDVTFTLQDGDTVSGTCTYDQGAVSGDTCEVSIPPTKGFINELQLFGFSIGDLDYGKLENNASAELLLTTARQRPDGGGYDIQTVEQIAFTNSCNVAQTPQGQNYAECTDGKIDYTPPTPPSSS